MAKILCFNIINGVAALPELHKLSDAGAGAELMHFTPTLDSEIIAYGYTLTGLPQQLLQQQKRSEQQLVRQTDGLLSNGGISPAVLVHGLLTLFAENGYEIEFRSFNFTDPTPRQIDNPNGWNTRHFSQDSTAPHGLQHQLNKELLSQSERGVISILAECGVGGTTFSTLWLRALTGEQLSPAGSTSDPEKLAAKATLLEALQRRHCQQGFDLDYMLAEQGAHDDIQASICGLIAQWPGDLPPPLFAGGMMMIAPLLACMNAGIYEQDCAFATTRWLLNGDSKMPGSWWPKQWQLDSHITDFSQSQHPCLHRYEQGYVVEGCGLGGMLVLAEQAGFNQDTIVSALDSATARHIAVSRKKAGIDD